MKREACIKGCKFNKKGNCRLYKTRLKEKSFPDPHDKGKILLWAKCVDCMEKEVSCSIDIKIREIYSFYDSFTYEMDILFKELEVLVVKREDIYK